MQRLLLKLVIYTRKIAVKTAGFITGFTLVEVMIVLAIFSIVGGAIFATLAIGRTSWQSGNVQVEVQQESRRGINRMVKELRQSGSATIVGVPADGEYHNSIAFQMPEDIDGDGDVVDANGNIEWGSQITYSMGGLDGKQLLRSKGGQVEVLANNITNFQFRRQATTPSIIEITLQSQKTTIQGQLIGTTLSTQVRLRN